MAAAQTRPAVDGGVLGVDHQHRLDPAERSAEVYSRAAALHRCGCLCSHRVSCSTGGARRIGSRSARRFSLARIRRCDLEQLTFSQRRPNATAAPGSGFGEMCECLACVLMALSATAERFVRLIELGAQLRDGATQEFKLGALLIAQFDTPIPSLIGLSHRPVFAVRRRAPARRAPSWPCHRTSRGTRGRARTGALGTRRKPLRGARTSGAAAASSSCTAPLGPGGHRPGDLGAAAGVGARLRGSTMGPPAPIRADPPGDHDILRNGHLAGIRYLLCPRGPALYPAEHDS